MSIKRILDNEKIDAVIRNKLENILVCLNLMGIEVEYDYYSVVCQHKMYFQVGDYYCKLIICFMDEEENDIHFIFLDVNYANKQQYNFIYTYADREKLVIPLIKLESILFNETLS